LFFSENGSILVSLSLPFVFRFSFSFATELETMANQAESLDLQAPDPIPKSPFFLFLSDPHAKSIDFFSGFHLIWWGGMWQRFSHGWVFHFDKY
jgi:hypothetical protein